MSRVEFLQCLGLLGISPAEAAMLLSVSERTVRRWAEQPEEIPGPAEQAIRAWCRLETLGLAWRPDGVAIGEDSPEEIADHVAQCRQHAIELDAALEKVRRRGGPRAPWAVDLEAQKATLGAIHVSFYRLANGSFSPQHYRRTDGKHDLKADWPLLEDAFACVADALAAERKAERAAKRHLKT